MCTLQVSSAPVFIFRTRGIVYFCFFTNSSPHVYICYTNKQGSKSCKKSFPRCRNSNYCFFLFSYTNFETLVCTRSFVFSNAKKKKYKRCNLKLNIQIVTRTLWWCTQMVQRSFLKWRKSGTIFVVFARNYGCLHQDGMIPNTKIC